MVLLAVNGSAGTEKFGPVDTVVPAHNSAVADFTTLATLFVPPVGSATTVEVICPAEARQGVDDRRVIEGDRVGR